MRADARTEEEADGIPSFVGKAGTDCASPTWLRSPGQQSVRLRGFFAADRCVLRWRRYKVDALKTLDARRERQPANSPSLRHVPVFCRLQNRYPLSQLLALRQDESNAMTVPHRVTVELRRLKYPSLGGAHQHEFHNVARHGSQLRAFDEAIRGNHELELRWRCGCRIERRLRRKLRPYRSRR